MSSTTSASLAAKWLRWKRVGVLASSAVGCVPEFEDRVSDVEERRVVAVKASPAEVEAGDTTTLSALVIAPDGVETADEDLDWALCEVRKPLTELGPVAQECIDGTLTDGGVAPAAGWVPLGVGASVTAEVSREACRLFGPLRPPREEGKPAGRPVDADLTGGYHQPVVLRTDPPVLGSIRLSCGVPDLPKDDVIEYNRSYRPNENPRIAAFDIRASSAARESSNPDEIAALVRAGARINLGVRWDECPEDPVCGDGLCTSGEDQVSCAEDCQVEPRACTGAEAYVWGNPETRRVESRREAMSVAWFATAGRFQNERTGSPESDGQVTVSRNDWTAPRERGEVQIWVVLRDDRGGVDWREYRLLIE